MRKFTYIAFGKVMSFLSKLEPGDCDHSNITPKGSMDIIDLIRKRNIL